MKTLKQIGFGGVMLATILLPIETIAGDAEAAAEDAAQQGKEREVEQDLVGDLQLARPAREPPPTEQHAHREEEAVGRQEQVLLADPRDRAFAQVDEDGEHASSLPWLRRRRVVVGPAGAR